MSVLTWDYLKSTTNKLEQRKGISYSIKFPSRLLFASSSNVDYSFLDLLQTTENASSHPLFPTLFLVLGRISLSGGEDLQVPVR